MPETITRPSADVAVRLLRDRLTVVAAAVEQLPKGSLRSTLVCCRDVYAQSIQGLSSGASVADYAAASHAALHVAIAVRQACCMTSWGDLLDALGGWRHEVEVR